MEGIKFLKLGRAKENHTSRGSPAASAGSSARKSARPTSIANIAGCSRKTTNSTTKTIPIAPRSQRDNWLVSYDYYKMGQEQVRHGDPLRTTPLIFHSQPMMSLINYAEDLESDSTAGETPGLRRSRQKSVETSRPRER